MVASLCISPSMLHFIAHCMIYLHMVLSFDQLFEVVYFLCSTWTGRSWWNIWKEDISIWVLYCRNAIWIVQWGQRETEVSHILVCALVTNWSWLILCFGHCRGCIFFFVNHCWLTVYLFLVFNGGRKIVFSSSRIKEKNPFQHPSS